MTRVATSLPHFSSSRECSENVTVVGRPRPDDDASVAGQSRKRKAPFEAAVHLQPSKVVLKNSADRTKKKRTEFLLNWVPPETTQEEYYKNFEGLVERFAGDCNCDAAILAYGATGSGKTFSTQGPALARRPLNGEGQHSFGIIQRAIQQILKAVDGTAEVHVCAVEVYCERVRDLLAQNTAGDSYGEECELLTAGSRTIIRHKSNRTNLTEAEIRSVPDAMAVLTRALHSRVVEATRKNEESSRSHLLVGVSICVRPSTFQQERQLQKLATIWLGDLCGSESFDLTASSHQQAETRFINKSLNTLNNCLHQLWLNQQKPGAHALIPVRSSALTRILSSAMNGRGHLALSVHFSMKEDDLEATRRTLDFAERAAQITVDARQKNAVDTAVLSSNGLASAQEFAALRAERNSLQRQLVAANRAVEEAYAAGFAAGQKAAQARVGQSVEDQPLLLAAGHLSSPAPTHSRVNGVDREQTLNDTSSGGRYCDQQPRKRLSVLRESFVAKRASDVPACPPSNSLQEAECSGSALKPPKFEFESPPRRDGSPVVRSTLASPCHVHAAPASTGQLQPPNVTMSPQCMSQQRSICHMSPAPTASYTTGSNGRRAEADWAAAKQRHIWESCDVHDMHEASTPTSAPIAVQNRPKACTMCTALLMCPVCAVEKPEVGAPVEKRDTVAHEQKRPPRSSSMRRSIQEVREGRKEKREGLEEQFLCMQADVRASTDGLPSAVKRPRASSMRASLPSGHWAESLSSRQIEGAKEGTSVRNSCSMALPRRKQGTWIPHGETLPEVSTEAGDRRHSFSSYNASDASAQNHASAKKTSETVRGEEHVDTAATESGKWSLLSAAGGSKRSFGVGGKRHSSGIHGNSLPPLSVASMHNHKLSVQTSHVAAIPAPPNGANSATNLRLEASCVDLVSSGVVGVRQVPYADQGLHEPDLDNPADGQENMSPCITLSPKLKRSTSLTELQKMMQCEPTSLPWADHLDGHVPIGAGRRGNVSVDVTRSLVKKKVVPKAAKRGR